MAYTVQSLATSAKIDLTIRLEKAAKRRHLDPCIRVGWNKVAPG